MKTQEKQYQENKTGRPYRFSIWNKNTWKLYHLAVNVCFAL